MVLTGFLPSFFLLLPRTAHHLETVDDTEERSHLRWGRRRNCVAVTRDETNRPERASFLFFVFFAWTRSPVLNDSFLFVCFFLRFSPARTESTGCQPRFYLVFHFACSIKRASGLGSFQQLETSRTKFVPSFSYCLPGSLFAHTDAPTPAVADDKVFTEFNRFVRRNGRVNTDSEIVAADSTRSLAAESTRHLIPMKNQDDQSFHLAVVFFVSWFHLDPLRWFHTSLVWLYLESTNPITFNWVYLVLPGFQRDGRTEQVQWALPSFTRFHSSFVWLYWETWSPPIQSRLTEFT